MPTSARAWCDKALNPARKVSRDRVARGRRVSMMVRRSQKTA